MCGSSKHMILEIPQLGCQFLLLTLLDYLPTERAQFHVIKFFEKRFCSKCDG